MTTIHQAYATACELLGQAQVEIAFLTRQLAEVTAERDEAAQRVVALTPPEPAECAHEPIVLETEPNPRD